MLFQKSLEEQENGYSHSYGIKELRTAIAKNERNKKNGGWNCTEDDVYVCHGGASSDNFAAFLEEGDILLIQVLIIHLIWHILNYMAELL